MLASRAHVTPNAKKGDGWLAAHTAVLARRARGAPTMADTAKLDQLIAALDALSPAEHDAVLRRLRGKFAALPMATLLVLNRGKSEALIDDGGPPRSLEGGAKFEIAIPPLPLARSTETPTVPDASGLPTSPKSLLSLRAVGSDQKGTDLRIDLSGWIAHAARCGWPFAFHRQPEKGAAGNWRFESRPVFDLAPGKSHSIDLIVIGLGVDLSEMAERFAMMFDSRSTDSKVKEELK